MVGLLGHASLPRGEGLLLAPAWSIHTWFMRFPIDVVFLDADGRVLRVFPELPGLAARVGHAQGSHRPRVRRRHAGAAPLAPGDIVRLERG